MVRQRIIYSQFLHGLAIFLAVVAGIIGLIAVFAWIYSPTKLPSFTRPMAPNCGEVFYCLNATDPNPSYIQYWRAVNGPVPAPWLPAFSADTSVFDVSDPFSTRVRVAGTYQFVVFTPMISFSGNFDVAIVLTRDPGVLLATPALSGDLGPSGLSNITVIPTRAATTTALIKLRAGESVRVGYVVNIDTVEVTPGAYFAGTLLNRD